MARSGPKKRPAESSMPEDVPFPMTPKERRLDGRARGLAKIKAERQLHAAKRAAGERTRLELYRAGELKIEDWTIDEVSHGQPANLNGGYEGAHVNFSGKQNAEIRRELLRRGEKQLSSYYVGALKVLEEIAEYGISEPSRVKAANLIVERIAGRTVEKIEIKSSDPWADILEEVLADEVLERMGDRAESSESSESGVSTA